jgi:hypothetical protein
MTVNAQQQKVHDTRYSSSRLQNEIAVKLNFHVLKQVAEADKRYQSFNIEMCEIVGDLTHYDVTRMDNEILVMNNILKALDWKNERTFAYPCGDMKIHDSTYLEYMKYKFVAARGVTPEMLTIDKVNLNNVGCYLENGASADEMIALVKKAMKTRTLLVFLFNGVGGEHKINVSLEAHSGLLHYLKQNEKDIWIATMIDVVKFIKSKQ